MVEVAALDWAGDPDAALVGRVGDADVLTVMGDVANGRAVVASTGIAEAVLGFKRGGIDSEP